MKNRLLTLPSLRDEEEEEEKKKLSGLDRLNAASGKTEGAAKSEEPAKKEAPEQQLSGMDRLNAAREKQNAEPQSAAPQVSTTYREVDKEKGRIRTRSSDMSVASWQDDPEKLGAEAKAKSSAVQLTSSALSLAGAAVEAAKAKKQAAEKNASLYAQSVKKYQGILADDNSSAEDKYAAKKNLEYLKPLLSNLQASAQQASQAYDQTESAYSAGKLRLTALQDSLQQTTDRYVKALGLGEAKAKEYDKQAQSLRTEADKQYRSGQANYQALRQAEDLETKAANSRSQYAGYLYLTEGEEAASKYAAGEREKEETASLGKQILNTLGGSALNFFDKYAGAPITLLADLMGMHEDAEALRNNSFNEEAQRMKQNAGKLGGMVIDTAGAAGQMLSHYAIGGMAAGALGFSGLATSLGKIANSSPLVSSAASRAGAKLVNNLLTEVISNPGNAAISLSSGVSGYYNARDNGASSEQALTSGILKGLSEYYSNKLFSGMPLENTPGEKGYVTEAIEYIAKKLGKNEALAKFNATTGSKILGWIYDKAGEGLEEVITGIADPIIDRITYDKTADWKPKADELIDEFTGGVLLSLLMSGGEAALKPGMETAQIKQQLMDMGYSKEIANTYAPQIRKAFRAAEKMTQAMQQAAEQTTPETTLARIVNKVTQGEALTGQDARKILADPEAMQALIDGGYLGGKVSNDSEGRKEIVRAAEEYAEDNATRGIDNATAGIDNATARADNATQGPPVPEQGLKLPAAEEKAPVQESKLRLKGAEEKAPVQESKLRLKGAESAPPVPNSVPTTENNAQNGQQNAQNPEKTLTGMDRLNAAREKAETESKTVQRTLATERQKTTEKATSLRDTGFTTAAEEATARIRAEENWDAEEKAVAQALRDMGYEPTFAVGLIENAEGNSVPFLMEGNKIAIRADHRSQSIQQIAENAVGQSLNIQQGIRQSAVDAINQAKETKKAPETPKVTPRAQAVLDSARETGASQEDAELAARLADMLGFDIRFVNEAGKNGARKNGYFKDGTLYINTQSNRTLPWIVGHELTHGTEASKYYDNLYKLAKKTLGLNWEAKVQSKLNTTARAAQLLGDESVRVDRDGAEREVVADFFADNLLTNEAAIRAVCEYQPTTARGIRDYIKKLLDKLGGKNTTLEKAVAMYNKALKDVAAKAQANAENRLKLPKTQQGRAQESGLKLGGKAQNSINITKEMPLKDQFKDYRAGKLSQHQDFYYGITPAELTVAGLEEHPLVMSQTDYKKSKTEKHNTPNRAMQRLSELLADPILSFETGNKIGFLVKDIDGDGKPLLIGIEKNVDLDGDPANRIKSAYGLDTPEMWIKNQIDEGKKMRVYDEKEADRFLNEFGYKAERTESFRFGDIVTPVSTKGKKQFEADLEAMTVGKDGTLVPERGTQYSVDSDDEYRETAGTPALEKLGIRLAGSKGKYHLAEQLLERDKAAKELMRATKKAEKKLNATKAEKEFAAGIAAGIYEERDIPKSMNKDKVTTLADYYAAEDSFKTNMLAEVRSRINSELQTEAEDLLGGVDNFKKLSMLQLNERTPDRTFRAMFGAEKGKEIFDWLVRPVQMNESEKTRWHEKQLDRVRKFTDSKGKTRKLTRAESELTMLVMEGKAAEAAVADMEKKGLDAKGIRNAAENIRNGQDPGDAAQEFNLKDKERELARNYATWMDTQEKLKDADSTIIETAAKEYSKIFDEFYDAINDFLVAHGYDPIGYIKGYAPHMQPEETQNLLEKAFDKMGIDLGNDKAQGLPASIAGETAFFKPNKRWDPYFLHRTGTQAQYDIEKAYQSYVGYLSDILYHTDDIMRVRNFEKMLRKTYAPDDISTTLDQIRDLRNAPTEDRLSVMRDAGKVGKTTQLSAQEINEKLDEWEEEQFNALKEDRNYNNLVMWLSNYANILAGKQSFADRGWEYSLGRNSLNFANRLQAAFQRSLVAGSLSSAMNQTAQLPMIKTELGDRWYYAALKDILTGQTKGFWQDSDFLTTKHGVDMLTTDNYDKFINGLFTPSNLVDNLVSTAAVRGKFLKEVHAGKSYSEAMRAADDFGRAVMGSREKGTRPLAYESKGLFSRMIHMFQVEAANSWDHIASDLPYEIKEIAKTQGKGKAARTLVALIIKGLLSAFLLNRATEEIYGGTPAPFDVIGLAMNFVASGKGMTTNQYFKTIIDNGLEKLGQDRLLGTEDTETDWDTGNAIEETVYNIMNDVPLARNVAGVLGLGDQTVPLPGAGGEFTDVGTAVKDLIGEGADAQTIENLIRASVKLGAQFAPAGRQITKTAEGIEAAVKGGSYSKKGKLQYAIDTPADKARSVLFGKNSTEAAREHWASGEGTMTGKQTEMVAKLRGQGMTGTQAQEATKTVKSFSGENKRDETVAYIDSLDITDGLKDEMYYYAGYKESTIGNTPWHNKGGSSGKGKTYAPADTGKLRLPPSARMDEQDRELWDMESHGGNVNLRTRKTIPVTNDNIGTVKGWGMDSQVGDYMTVASQTYRDGDRAVVVTPILPDGSLMTQKELDAYMDSLRGSDDYANADDRGIILGVFDNGSWQQNLRESDAFAERIHELHEEREENRKTSGLKMPSAPQARPTQSGLKLKSAPEAQPVRSGLKLR